MLHALWENMEWEIESLFPNHVKLDEWHSNKEERGIQINKKIIQQLRASNY